MAANNNMNYYQLKPTMEKYPRKKSRHIGAKIIWGAVFTFALLFIGIYMGRNDITPLVHIRSEYMIGIYEGPSPLEMSSAGKINPIVTAEMVTDVKADFVADPFMIKDGQTWYMFFEILESVQHKGIIGLALSEDGLNWTYDKVVLEEPFHLSYPMVFRYNDEIVMIPETHEDYSVSVYKTESFPYEWKKDRTILEGNFIDPTVINHEDHWYMFVSDRNDMLLLYESPDLYGEWRPHPASPIIRQDLEHARPAGRVVRSGSNLIRFTQNCKPTYGWDVRAFIISELTPEIYKEEPFAANPILKGSGSKSDWNGIRMHHIDAHETDEGVWIAVTDGVGRWTEFGFGIFGPKISKSIGPKFALNSPYKR